MSTGPFTIKAEQPSPKLAFLRDMWDRRRAREGLLNYITYTTHGYKVSDFARIVCAALDQFYRDVKAGLRPVLVLQAPPQHGKSEIVSRKLPAYLMGLEPDWRIGAGSYNDDLAHGFAQDVRRAIAGPEHNLVFPGSNAKRKFDRNTIGEFNNPRGRGSYFAGGVATSWSGKPLDIGIIDDPTKDQKEALSETVKENHWNWFQSTFLTRLSECSGIIIMATQWAEDDLPSRIIDFYKTTEPSRIKHLSFPAINSPSELNYQPQLKEGALIPELHSLKQLLEFKAVQSDYWWSALFQQSAKALGGNVFKDSGIQYYMPGDLPDRFDQVIDSWDCTFKDTDGTDFVVGQKWGKRGANSYLLAQIRGRMGFTATAAAVERLQGQMPYPNEILIEDKANGPAVIDFLKKTVPRLIAIEPDGSKLARAYAVTSVWEARNVFIPAEGYAPAVMIDSGKPGQIKTFTSEITIFNAGAHDDQVDAMTQALRHLYPLFGFLAISKEALNAAARR